MKVLEVPRHRNGICGEPFYVIRFIDNPDGHEENFIATLFDESGQCAVIGLDRIEKMGVTMSRGNSWRGDHFETELREYCKKYEERAMKAFNDGDFDAVGKKVYLSGCHNLPRPKG